MRPERSDMATSTFLEVNPVQRYSVRDMLLTRHDATDTICITALKDVDGRIVATERFCTGVNEAAALIERSYQREDIKAIWSNLQRLKPGSTKRKNETIDSDTNLLIDIDRKNKKDAQGRKVNATEEERKVLLEAANQVAAFLSPEFGQPVFADSGNGYHLSWRIGDAADWGKGIPVEQGQELYKRLLALLKRKFERPDLNMEIDDSLADATQVVTVWGTYNRKYPDLPGRPQRQSEMLSIPGHMEAVLSGDLKHAQVVAWSMIEQLLLTNAIDDVLVEEGKPATSGEKKQDKQTANQDWLENYGVPDLIDFWSPEISYESDSYDKNGEEHHPITPCPCHKDEEFHDHSYKRDCEIIVFPDGGIGISCFSRDFGLKQVIRKMNEIKGEKYPHLIFEQESVEELLYFFGAEDADWQADGEVTEDRTTALLPKIFGFTDLANAQRFAWRYAGKFVFTKATGWLTYDRGRWRRDNTFMAQQAMRKTLALIAQEAQLVKGKSDKDQEFREAIEAHAKSCEMLKKFNAAMKTAENMAEFARDYEIFDQQPDLFLCGNGTLNLKTGEFGPFDPRHLLTKGSNVIFDPNAKCPKWEKFLLDVQQGKEHMVRYLARALGYTLTTDTGGQCLFVPYGTGGTGKSQFLNVMRGILGDYVFEADAEMFMAKKGDSGQPFEYAGMEGKRALFASETEANKELATAKVKRMTGQEPIRASYKGKDHYHIVPVFKVWLATNDRPKMNATDDAMWDRPKLIPFDRKFRDAPGEVKNIAEMLLKEEASGILNWMLAGHAEWKAVGLKHPDEVNFAVKEWRGDEDYLSRFLEEETTKTAVQNDFVSIKVLFEQFTFWAHINREGAGTGSVQFTQQMKRKGFTADQKWVMGRNQRVWLGLKYTGRVPNYGVGVMEDADAV